MKKLINKILLELSARVGVINLQNEEHLDQLGDVLDEMMLSDIKQQLIQNLRESKALTDQAKAEIKSKGLEHMGYGYYGKNNKVTHKKNPETGELETSNQDEFEKQNDKEQKSAGNTPKKDTDTKQKTGGGEVDEPEPVGNLVGKPSEFAHAPDVADRMETEKTPEQVKQEKETQKEKLAVEDNSDFSKKSETTDGLFAGQSQYQTVKSNGKDITYRPLLDPLTNEPLDTSIPEQRKRAIEILDERVKLSEPKVKRGVKELDNSKLDKTQRTAIYKWLGEYGELEAYRSLLKNDKIPDVYLLTDSEKKNDLVIVDKKGDDRNVWAKGVSVKTVKKDTMANKRGSSVKPDLDSALNNAETRKMTVEGLDGEIDAGVVMNSMLELRKRLIKDLSNGAVRQNPKTKASEVKMGDKYVSITQYFRDKKVTLDDVNRMFDNDNYFKGKNSAIRGLMDEEVGEEKMEQIKTYMRNKFTSYTFSGEHTLAEMQEKMVDEFADIMENLGANLTPSTDTMVSYYDKGGFVDNKFIAKEQAEEAIVEELGVKSFDDISKKEQLVSVLGIDLTGRGMGKKKEGQGHIDGQSFGRPKKSLYPDPVSFDTYVNNYLT